MMYSSPSILTSVPAYLLTITLSPFFTYILALYLISSIISKDFSLNIYSIIMMATSILIGGIGGIIGVNKK